MLTMKWVLPAAIALAAACLPGRVDAVEPRLEADGRHVRSFEPPAVVSLPDNAQYLGNRRWVLYGYADCDLHLFVDTDVVGADAVETDAKGVVTRLYWIQSEGYLDSRPELTHAGDYDDSRKIDIGGLRFHLDTWTRDREDAAPADSDLEQVDRLIAESGLSLPEDMVFVRLVHLPDPAQRKELMIIYAERRTDAIDASRQEAAAVANMKARIGVRLPGTQ